ncbi:4240_t:CDS:1, partial [Scutellospora calospora]
VIHIPKNYDFTEDNIVEDNNISEKINISEDNNISENNINENKIVEGNNIEENSSTETLLTEDEKINMKYCQKKTCNFMFPYVQLEQETRSNIHTRTYIQLARSLNRTMVLVNVGNSRLNACNPHPFNFYYDIEALQKQYPDVQFISQDKFLKWTKERKIRPIAQHSLMIQDEIDNITMGVNEGIKLKMKKMKKLCIDQFNLNIINYIEIHTGFKEFTTKSLEKMSQLAIKTLKKSPMAKKYEVIMILNLSKRDMFFLSSEKLIPYSPYIIKESKKITKKLTPYVAIHWRVERAEPKMVPKCAKKLIEKVKTIQEQYGIKNFYLATDLPLNGNKAQSGTLHEISEFHKEAIEILGLNNKYSNNLKNSSKYNIKFDTWISLNSFSQIRDNPKYKNEFKGSGIHGILDKLVCINANYFLKTPKGCGRTSSNFARVIIEERKNLKKDNVSNW